MLTTMVLTEVVPKDASLCIIRQHSMASGRTRTALFFKPFVDQRANLKIMTKVMVRRVIVTDSKATGVEYVGTDGNVQVVLANKEVILCSGAIQSPQLLQLSGIGPKAHLSSCGIQSVVDLPQVGQGLKDHLLVLMVYSAPGIGIPMLSLGLSLGPDALRQNPTQVFDKGPLPADPSEDAALPNELKQLKVQAEQMLEEYMKTGKGFPTSTLYDASVFCSSGRGDFHTHDVQIAVFGSSFNRDAWEGLFHIDCSQYFTDPSTTLAATAENVVLVPGILQPHSQGCVTIESKDPMVPPKVDFDYYSDGHDVEVMKTAMRRSHEIAANMDGVGKLYVPAHLAKKHAYDGESLTDALLEDWIYHYTQTYYHAACTCRIGSVVDSQLKVMGVTNLRVADASVMPNIVSGNTQAACYMIAEKAAAMIADEHSLSMSASDQKLCPCLVT